MREYVKSAIETGILAAGVTTLAAASVGTLEQNDPLAPINAVSHIAWGDEAARHSEASLKYTGTGLVLNAMAVAGWAILHVACFQKQSRSLDRALALGAVTSAAAYVTDYHIVPQRVTPGFEKVVKPRSLLMIYAALAGALGVGTWMSSSARAQ